MALLEALTALMQPHGPRVQKMFGGTCFLVNENLVIGTHKDGLIVRVGPGGTAGALENPFATQMEMGGREMKGWILVSADGCASAEALRGWVEQAMAFNRTLPPAAAKSRTRAAARPSG
jgi:hypothetical protein